MQLLINCWQTNKPHLPIILSKNRFWGFILGIFQFIFPINFFMNKKRKPIGPKKSDRNIKKTNVLRRPDMPNSIFPSEIWGEIIGYIIGHTRHMLKKSGLKCLTSISHTCTDLYNMESIKEAFKMDFYRIGSPNCTIPNHSKITKVILEGGYLDVKQKYDIEHLKIDSFQFQPWMLISCPKLKCLEIENSLSLVWDCVDLSLLKNIERMKLTNLYMKDPMELDKFKILKYLKVETLKFEGESPRYRHPKLETLVIQTISMNTPLDGVLNVKNLEIDIRCFRNSATEWKRLTKLSIHLRTGYMAYIYGRDLRQLSDTLEDLRLDSVNIDLSEESDKSFVRVPFLKNLKHLVVNMSTYMRYKTKDDLQPPFDWRIVENLENLQIILLGSVRVNNYPVGPNGYQPVLPNGKHFRTILHRCSGIVETSKSLRVNTDTDDIKKHIEEVCSQKVFE